ncbi:MAG: VWA domain-containing protein, partial [Acidobacteriota bacterium]
FDESSKFSCAAWVYPLEEQNGSILSRMEDDADSAGYNLHLESGRVQVNLVLVDVVVRDRKDRPISGLSKGDFKVLIDDRGVDAQAIASFEEICAGAEREATPGALPARPGNAGKSSPAVGRGETAATAPRYIILYFDFSNLSIAGRGLSLKAARDFISAGVDPSDRFMLLVYKHGLRLVQDFTSSSADLVLRLDALREDRSNLEPDVLEEFRNFEMVASKACTSDRSGNGPLDRSHNYPASTSMGAISSPSQAADTCPARSGLATAFSMRESRRARQALTALADLMPALDALPGRKALVLFTDSLRAEPGIQYEKLARGTPDRVASWWTTP